ncbi:MAG TPA: hypothetical protein VF821_23295, partial [Lentzea sp.]
VAPATPAEPPTPLAPPDDVLAEPANIWAPPAGPPAPPAGPPGPYPAYPYPAAAPQPQRTSRLGLVIAGLVVALVIGTLGGFYSWVKKEHDTAATSATSSPPTTTTPPKPYAEIGDCVKLTGASFNPTYKKVACDAGLHNYTVSKVPATDAEKCGEDAAAYTKYTAYSAAAGRKNAYVCLIPVFVEGQCYDFTLSSLNAELKTVECGGFQAVKAKVLANTVDKAACGESPALAIAYPEIKTTYCFTHTFQYGG